MKTKKRPQSLINKLISKNKLLSDINRSAPSELYYELLALEEDFKLIDESHKSYKELVARSTVLADECRKWRASNKKMFYEARRCLKPLSDYEHDNSISFNNPEIARKELLIKKKASWLNLTKEKGTYGNYIEKDSPNNDFILEFESFTSFQGLNNNSSVHDGIIGECGNDAFISNINGKGLKSDYMTFFWIGIVPNDDIYFMDAGQPIVINGSCFADGYVKPGVDAIAEVNLNTFIQLENTTLFNEQIEIQDAYSRLCPETNTFNDYLIKPQNFIYFQAKKGEYLYMMISLEGNTWTRGRGDAEIEIDRFGILCNVREDLNVQVIS